MEATDQHRDQGVVCVCCCTHLVCDEIEHLADGHTLLRVKHTLTSIQLPHCSSRHTQQQSTTVDLPAHTHGLCVRLFSRRFRCCASQRGGGDRGTSFVQPSDASIQRQQTLTHESKRIDVGGWCHAACQQKLLGHVNNSACASKQHKPRQKRVRQDSHSSHQTTPFVR
jgi:hypothetical protein